MSESLIKIGENTREQIFVIFLFCFALILRLLYTVFLRRHYLFYDDPAGDVLYYQKWAQEIAHGHWVGNKVFWGLPLYPYFLAVLERLTFHNLELIRFIHLALGSLNCVLVYYIAERIFLRKVAIGASLLMATNFVLIYYDWLLMPVTLTITLSCIVILVLSQSNSSLSKREWFLLGLLIGLGSLLDGKFIIFFLLFLIISLNRCFQKAMTAQQFLSFFLGCVIVLSVVAVRNRIVGGSWVLVSAQTGLSFYSGNKKAADGIFDNEQLIRPNHGGQDEDQQIIAEQTLKRKLTPAEVSNFWKDKAFQFIKESPGDYIKLLFRKLYLFGVETEEADDIDLLLQQDWKQRFDFNPFAVIFPLGLMGIVLNDRDHRRKTVLLDLFIFSQLLFTIIFFLTTKHRVTVLPFLLIYEVYSLYWVVEKLKQGQWGKVFGFLLIATGLSICFHPVRINPNIIALSKFSKSGAIFERQGAYEEASHQYLQALKMSPNDTTLLYNLANVSLKRGQVGQAIDYYQKALAINPIHLDALFNLGVAYAESGNFASALGSYRKILGLAPGSPDVYYRMANIYRQQGDCEQSQGYYKKIFELQPEVIMYLQEEMKNCLQKR